MLASYYSYKYRRKLTQITIKCIPCVIILICRRTRAFLDKVAINDRAEHILQLRSILRQEYVTAEFCFHQSLYVGVRKPPVGVMCFGNTET